MSLPTAVIVGITSGVVSIIAISILLTIHIRRTRKRKTIKKNRASLMRTYGNEEKPYGVSVVVMEGYPRAVEVKNEGLGRCEMEGVGKRREVNGAGGLQELPGWYGGGKRI
jgi:hypothetical protein